MAILDLVVYPDKRLRNHSNKVVLFDASLNTLVNHMIDTMHHHNGIGLAAPQIGEALRLFVVDVSESRKEPRVYVNPLFLEKHGTHEYEEGCLSVPNYQAKVTRPEFVTIKAQDVTGKWFEHTAEGLLATCLQHEHDHLEGTLFIDYLSSLKRSRAEKKVNKWLLEKEEALS